MAKTCMRALARQSGIFVASLAFSTIAHAGDIQVDVRIPASGLGEALAQFSQQTKQPLLFEPGLVYGRNSSGVRGRLTPSAALHRILSGSGLTAQRTPNGAFVLKPAPEQIRVNASLESPRTPPEEITVTAERRAESIQDTPISILAFNARLLEDKSISGVADLNAQVPNLQITPFPGAATTQRLYLRGIGSNNDQFTQDPSVAVYIDGVYVARSQGLATEVSDLDRIEVLRGPQGSLYGRNATGGAINFVTTTPELGAFHFKQTLTIGRDNLFQTRSVTNMPVGENAAIQLSYFHRQKDGPTRNRGTGVSRFGDQDRDAYRGAFRWRPTDALDLRYTYDRTETNDTPAYAAPVPLYPASADRPKFGSPYVHNLTPNDITSQGHNLTIDWAAADMLQIKSITGYRRLDSFINQNYSPGAFGPFPASMTKFDQSQHQFSEELQAIGIIGDRIDYVAGLYYFSEEAEGRDTAFQMDTRLIARAIDVENKAYAIYAQGAYTPPILDDQLHITLGARWSRDERRAVFQRAITLGSAAPIVEPAGAGDRSFEDFSPSATIAFDFTEDIKGYAKVANGYKTGGYNVGASSLARFSAGFSPEDVTSYELGLKSDLAGRRLRANIALFSMDYTDIQVNVPDSLKPAQIDVINAGKAEIKGVELDVTARLTNALTLTFNYAYLDATYTEVLNAAGENIAAAFPFTSAPSHSASSALEYEFPKFPVGVLTGRVEYNYRDKQFGQANDARYIIGQYSLLNARLTLSNIPMKTGELRAALWGRNLSDEPYYITTGNFFAPGALFGDPMSFGIDLSFTY